MGVVDTTTGFTVKENAISRTRSYSQWRCRTSIFFPLRLRSFRQWRVPGPFIRSLAMWRGYSPLLLQTGRGRIFPPLTRVFFSLHLTDLLASPIINGWLPSIKLLILRQHDEFEIDRGCLCSFNGK